MSSTPAAQIRQTAQRIEEFVESGGRDAHRHRVHPEVAAHQVGLERIAEPDLRVARHAVVGVGAERRELEVVTTLRGADGAELDTGVPQRVSPGAEDLLDPRGPRVGGEIEIGAQAAEQRVAHTAPDEIQLVTRIGKQTTEFAEHGRVPVERHRGRGHLRGIGMGVVRHVR